MMSVNDVRSCSMHLKITHSSWGASAKKMYRKATLLNFFGIMDSDRDVGQLASSTLRWPSRRARLPVPELDPYHLFSDDSDEERLLKGSYHNGAISGESVDLGYLERLRAQRPRRKSYSGDLLKAINNLHDDKSKNWRSVPPTERERHWMVEFRMPEGVVEELLSRVKARVSTFLSITPSPSPPIGLYSGRDRSSIKSFSCSGCHLWLDFAAVVLISKN
jgi:hypothetical protein